MKTLALAIALIAVPALALANDGGPTGPNGGNQAGVPAQSGKTRSGYEIPGCENYEQVGAATRQVCNINSAADPNFWRQRDKFNPGAASGAN